MKLPKLLDSPLLKDIMRKYNYMENTSSKLKVLDCTYAPTPVIPHQKFKEEYYGKFDKLMTKMSKHKFMFMREHIPGAVFLDIDTAFYPSPSQRFAVYEPKIFEQYAQLLGLNSDDHLVFYGRGTSLPAMIFSTRMYWLFKSYGHDRLSVLNGGLNSWRDEFQFDVESAEEIPTHTKGDWKAENCAAEFRVTYNELKDGVFDRLDEVNLLDARTRAQFEGKAETGLDPYFVNGSYITGSKNLPAMELLTNQSKLKSDDEIRSALREAGFQDRKPTYTLCMVGMQASLLSFTLDALKDPISNKLYAGSLYEIAHLDPKRINGKSDTDD